MLVTWIYYELSLPQQSRLEQFKYERKLTISKCPRTKTSFEVSNTDLAKFLREKGRKQTEEPKLSEIEIKQLIRRFCIPREMNFVGLGLDLIKM